MDLRLPQRHPRHSPAILAVLVAALALPAAQRHTLAIPSPSMGGHRRALVVTPVSYHSGDRRYPVIYLLHGYGSSPRQWLRVGRLGALADTHDVILVCPDGGRGSWWLDSPVRAGSRFGTHVADDVVAEVDRRYRTVVAPEGRAVAGSSMGGHGALTLLASRPELFCAAAAISGVPDLAACGERWGLVRVLGSLEGNAEQWRAHSFTGMVERLAGTGRTVVLVWGRDDWAAEANRRARDLAESTGVRVEWEETDGGHTPEFVRAQLPGVVRRLVGLMKEESRGAATE